MKTLYQYTVPCSCGCGESVTKELYITHSGKCRTRVSRSKEVPDLKVLQIVTKPFSRHQQNGENVESTDKLELERNVTGTDPTFQEVQEAAKTVRVGGRCEAPGQRCGMIAEGNYKITLYDPDKGEIKKELGLCRRHYQKAVKEGAEIELL